MYHIQNVTDDIYYIGGNDRRIALFENVYPLENGVSYNSYFVSDEKTAVLDTVDSAISGLFFENINHLLGDRSLDYLIINHMEPDHAATIGELVLRYPDVQIICEKKAYNMIRQFFDIDMSNVKIVAEGDTLSTGRHTFTFVMAPMVHWPEVMVTYDTTDKILFSADAFGTFGALSGNIFADQMNFKEEWLDEARRYYTNIVGKYGTQVQALLKKAEGLEINMICPLHGPVWRRDIPWFIEKYDRWSKYAPEENGVVIAYASVYGNTQNVAEIIAGKLSLKGITNIKMYDVSKTHPSYIISEAFKYSHIVIASTTYNAGIFVNMENFINDLAHHNLQNRTFAIVQNGSWAPTAGNLITEKLSKLKNSKFIEPSVTVYSALKENGLVEIDLMVDEIYNSIPNTDNENAKNTEANALFKLSYGLFVLTAKNGEKDNGCIINTVMQITDIPKRIIVSVNKQNYTHDMILKSGEFNVSILSTDVPFEIFQKFGFASGRDTDKFTGFDKIQRSENDIYYLTEFANSYISGKVINVIDCGTHTMFVADVTNAKVLSDIPSVTYQYYFDHIKPKPKAATEKKKGFVCKICGYVYEGETLPPDFICPLCKHGAEDFEPLE